MARMFARRWAALHSGNAMAMFAIDLRRSLTTTRPATLPRSAPDFCALFSGSLRTAKLSPRSAARSAPDLNALSFGPATDEFLHERVPFAALAQQAFDELAERAMTAASCEFPRRGGEDFRRGVRWRR